MGMETSTTYEEQLKINFDYRTYINKLEKEYSEFDTLSMGMSGDYEVAIAHDSNMVRVGSSIFGERNY